jgi:hypothetical protein
VERFLRRAVGEVTATNDGHGFRLEAADRTLHGARLDAAFRRVYGEIPEAAYLLLQQ